MASTTAISVSHLTKEYRIVERGEPPTTLAESLRGRMRRPRGRRPTSRVLALDDVSFDVATGQIVGIIGPNGAGKSTLLKVLTRVTDPTSGKAYLRGRVGSLLEIGAGFHPELTGKENVFLNGTLLGMKRKEIQRRFDDIVAFADVERFLDTPVKRYSTGMYVRLAFAVAAHVDSEILVVDEVLAVGDSNFQKKCLEEMRNAAQSGRTVLLVSHQAKTLSSLATTALYLRAGQLAYSGDIGAALDAYARDIERDSGTEGGGGSFRPGNGLARFRAIAPSERLYEPQEEKVLTFSVSPSAREGRSLALICEISDSDHVLVAQCDSRLVGIRLRTGDPTRAVLRIRTPWLRPGRYTVDAFLWSSGELVDQWDGACSFEVLPHLPYEGLAPDASYTRAPVLTDFSYDIP